MNQIFNVTLFLLSVCLVIGILRGIISKRIKLFSGIIYISVICIYGLYYIYNFLLFVALKIGIVTGTQIMLNLALFKKIYVEFFEFIPMVFIICLVIHSFIKSNKLK